MIEMVIISTIMRKFQHPFVRHFSFENQCLISMHAPAIVFDISIWHSVLIIFVVDQGSFYASSCFSPLNPKLTLFQINKK